MKDRSPVTCLHPNCFVAVARGRSCCGKHFAALTEEYRTRLARAKGETLGALKAEIREWFESRMIGPHEKTFCIDGCGADVVWLPTFRGKRVPVDPAGVLKSDDVFIRARHAVHFDSCPKRQIRGFGS